MSQKLTALPVSTSLPSTALLYAVDDSLPADKSRKITLDNLSRSALPPPKLNIITTGVTGGFIAYAHGWHARGMSIDGMTESRIMYDIDGPKEFEWIWCVSRIVLDSVGCTGVTFSNLEEVGNIYATDSGLEALNYPELRNVWSDFFCNGVALAELTLPLLEHVETYFTLNYLALPAISLPALKYVGKELSIVNCTSLTSISLPALQSVGVLIAITDCTSLTSLSLPALLSVGSIVSLGYNALDETSVDEILVKLAALDGTGGTMLFENGEVILDGGTNSAPSVTGLAAKATLEGRGCTVTVNP